MYGQTKRNYKSHKFENSLLANFVVDNGTANLDRFYMNQLIKPCVDYLNQNGIKNLQDFTRLFKKYKLKSDDIIKFIKNFQIYIKTRIPNTEFNWIRSRELIKSNFDEKNIIINRFALEYYDFFILFVSSYFSYNYPNMNKITEFVDQIKYKTNELIKEKENNQNQNETQEYEFDHEYGQENADYTFYTIDSICQNDIKPLYEPKMNENINIQPKHKIIQTQCKVFKRIITYG